MQHILGESYLNLTPTQWAVVIAGMAMIFSIQRWRKNAVRQAQQKTKGPATMERTVTGSALNVREVTAEIQSLVAELEETARRVAAQIDNRKRALEQVIAEADEKIRRLEALTRAEAGAAPAASPGMGTGRDAATMLSRLRQERGAPPANEDPAYRPIYELADQGKSAREIGQALGRQPGEVELILALRGRQRV